jgi:hypothetical protein
MFRRLFNSPTHRLLGLIAVAVLLMATAGCSSDGGVKSPTAPVASPATPPPSFTATSGGIPSAFNSMPSRSFRTAGDSDDDSDFDSDFDSDSGNDSDEDSGDDSDFDSDSGDDSGSDSGSSNRGSGGGSDNSGPGSNNSGPGSENSGGDDLRIESDRFRGSVSAVDAPGGNLMLNDGFVIVVGGDALWRHNSDLFSLFDVEAALLSGKAVRVEGEGVFNASGFFEATEIRARQRGRSRDDSGSVGGSSDDSPGDFESQVLFADRASRTLQLANGLIIAMDGGTFWDPLGDLFSVRQIDRALSRGELVRVEGNGTVQPDGSVLASQLKAESDGPDGAGDDDDDDDDDDDFEGLADEFDGRVTAVDPGAGMLRLGNGFTIRVDGATSWSSFGDLFNLDQTAAAVARGALVRAEGDGALQNDGTILASSIKVEVDD